MTVILEWGQEDGVLYDVSVVPNVTIRLNQSTLSRFSVLLIVSYNIQYNVSVVATLCGRSTTHVTELRYGKLHSCMWIQLN